MIPQQNGHPIECIMPIGLMPLMKFGYLLYYNNNTLILCLCVASEILETKCTIKVLFMSLQSVFTLGALSA